MITRGGFGVGGSGSGDGDGDVWVESPLRDPAKGKDPVVVEEALGEVPVEQAEF